MDETVLHDMFGQYYRPLCFHARRYLSCEEDVKDVVMDAFMTVYKKGLGFPDSLSLRSFLYTAVHNASMNLLRSDSRRRRRDDRFASLAAETGRHDDPLQDMIEDEVMFRLLSAIEQMPAQCSRVFKAGYLDGMNISETALLLGISENTVRTQRARAKKLLREKLRDLYPLLVLLWL